MSELGIGFMGGGQMARALASGFVKADRVKAEQIGFFDPSPEAAAQFLAQVPGSRLLETEQQVVTQAEVVLLAVKPQVMPQVVAQLAGKIPPETLVVSIAAGISLDYLQTQLATTRVIRVMPNTPCLVGTAASAYAIGAGATPEDAQRVEHLMTAVGLAFALEEHHIDAVTGLSGSGPAYVYLLIDAMTEGGVAMGLPAEVAAQLAAQTVAGAARMVQESGEHPMVLTDHVTSPGGTTLEGLAVLKEQGVREAVVEAVRAATERSIELGKA
ncbi:MAG: pyrroline-5-carboxylate reductase [Planctomycetota bacterium]|nr:pyrroline-5-carboxylate reductase [Planctomycetota bacterium]